MEINIMFDSHLRLSRFGTYTEWLTAIPYSLDGQSSLSKHAPLRRPIARVLKANKFNVVFAFELRKPLV